MLIKNKFYFKNGIEINNQLISNLITGTAPLVISSTTVVDNLNADLLDGFHASDFVKVGQLPSASVARLISITGDASWSVSFDGSNDVTSPLVLSNSGVTSGTYKSVTVDSKGRVTSGTNPTTVAGYGITDAVVSSALGSTIPTLVSGKIPLTQIPSSLDIENLNIGTSTSSVTVKNDLNVVGDLITFKNGLISSSEVTTSATTPVSIVSLPINKYRSVKYSTQVTQSTNYNYSDITVLHNGTDINFNEYGNLFLGTENLGTFSSEISNNNLVLIFTPISSADMTVKVISTAIEI